MDPEIQLTATVSHLRGPVITDLDHVRQWVVCDGQAAGSSTNGITFEVCPHHPDPDQCRCDDDYDPAYYRLTFVCAD